MTKLAIFEGSKPATWNGRWWRSHRGRNGPGVAPGVFKSASTASFAGFFLLALLIAVGVVPGLAWGQVPNVGDLTATEIRPVFSPDGTKLASVSADGIITVYDLHSGDNLATIVGTPESVSAIAFSPDGQLIAGARYDTISVSSAEDGTEIAFLAAESGRTITSLGFSPAGIRSRLFLTTPK